METQSSAGIFTHPTIYKLNSCPIQLYASRDNNAIFLEKKDDREKENWENRQTVDKRSLAKQSETWTTSSKEVILVSPKASGILR